MSAGHSFAAVQGYTIAQARAFSEAIVRAQLFEQKRQLVHWRIASHAQDKDFRDTLDKIDDQINLK